MKNFKCEERYMVVKLSKLSNEFNEDGMQRIMYILDADWKGAEVQLKAQIQCAIIDALGLIK